VNQIFAEVHKSNMTKESLNRDVGGKSVKGNDYQSPVLEESKL
jgi:predicted HAD superfamily Cof-like phosphohydrolase